MAGPSPEIGLLLPVYNAATTLCDTLQSLSRQTESNFVAACVDDGSTDESPRILEDWSRRDGRFVVLRREHEGLVPALNAGLAALETPLVARLDADDIALPRRLELQSAWMREHPETTVLGCGYDILSDSEPGAGSILYRDWQNSLLTDDSIRREMFVESPLVHPTVTFRREAVVRLGGYRDAGWAEDYDLWLRLAANGARFAKIPDLLVLWRDHPGRLTWTDRRYATEQFARCKAHHLARGPLAGRGPILIGGAGIAGGRLGRALLDEGIDIAAFLDVDPRKIGGTKRGRPVLTWDEGLARFPGTFIVVAVGSRGARRTVREYLAGRGLVETRDYLCAA
jgi:glycosyltransferase involved in cell wall biosynthesis